jgi:site-specific recombinase XerD
VTIHQNALVPVAVAELPAVLLADDLGRASDLARESMSLATRRAYGSDFAIFRAWCTARGVSPLPATAESTAAFLASEAARGIKPSTVGRRCAAIKFAHKIAGAAVPTDDERVKATVRGIRRTLGTAKAKKTPATCERLIPMALGTGDGLIALRDRSLLLIGFAGAFRRSELVALDVADIEETESGLRIVIRHSKTDQEGAGQTIAIPRGSIACPVAALAAWRTAAGITSGALFRSVRKGGKVGARLSGQSVGDIVKTHAKRCGLDPALFSGHSLRSGFLTSAAARGASVFKLMDQSRHRSMDTLAGYVRDANLFVDHAGSGLL